MLCIIKWYTAIEQQERSCGLINVLYWILLRIDIVSLNLQRSRCQLEVITHLCIAKYVYRADSRLIPANERRRYKVTPSLIGRVQTRNQPWYALWMNGVDMRISYAAVWLQLAQFSCDDCENAYFILSSSSIRKYCLGLGHETMVCAACLTMFFCSWDKWYQIRIEFDKFPLWVPNG